MKSRFHEVIVRVRFDVPITRRAAVQEFKNNIHGDFYPGDFSEAEHCVIKTVRSAGLVSK